MSNFLNLNLLDLLKGLLVAVLAAVLSAILPIIQAGGWPTADNFKAILLTGITAGVAYLLKNLFSNSQGIVAKPEQK